MSKELLKNNSKIKKLNKNFPIARTDRHHSGHKTVFFKIDKNAPKIKS